MVPFGIVWLDKLIGKIFHMKGDFVGDFRLIDYLMTVQSTEESPALNGQMGNNKQLKKDLMDLGIFDERMSLYLLYKLQYNNFFI